MSSKDLRCQLVTLPATRHAGLCLDWVRLWSPTITSLSSNHSLPHVTAMLPRVLGKTGSLLRSNSCRDLIRTQRAQRSTSLHPRKSYLLLLHQNSCCHRRHRRARLGRSLGQFYVTPGLHRSPKCTMIDRTAENAVPRCLNHRNCRNVPERKTSKHLVSAPLLPRGQCRSAAPSLHSALHSPPTTPPMPESS